MRPCTPTQDAPAPRESAVKSASHPTAPVGESSQIRRHHLTPTPVQQLCTDVQSCDQSVFSLWTVHGPFLFWQDRKGPPPRPARWGEEAQGSGRSFRRRRKRS